MRILKAGVVSLNLPPSKISTASANVRNKDMVHTEPDQLNQ
jgi:hypothetical protein